MLTLLLIIYERAIVMQNNIDNTTNLFQLNAQGHHSQFSCDHENELVF